MIYKFSAKWCSSCLITGQNFQKLVEKFEKFDFKIDFSNIDVDSLDLSDINLMKQFGINDKSVLPVIVFTDDKDLETQRLIGEQDYNQLLEAIDKDIGLNNKSSPSSNFKSEKKSGFLTKLSNIFK